MPRRHAKERCRARVRSVAAKEGLEQECLDEYDRNIEKGYTPEHAAWCALYEWDCLPAVGKTVKVYLPYRVMHEGAVLHEWIVVDVEASHYRDAAQKIGQALQQLLGGGKKQHAVDCDMDEDCTCDDEQA